jgi:PAS domain S-box-containing protein
MSSPDSEFFSASPDPCCVLDSAERFVSVNPSFERTLGHPVSRLTGRLWHELVHPDDQGAVRSAMKRAEAPGETTWLEARWITRNGDYRSLSWHLARGRDGAVFCSGYDVSRQKRLADEGASWRQRLELAIAAGDGAHWDWNPSTDEVEVSPGWLSLAGKPRTGPSTMRVEELKRSFRAEDLSSLERAIQGHLEDRKALKIDCRLNDRGSAAEARWVRVTGQAAWDDSGRPTRLSCWIHDLTESRAEKDLLVDQQIRLLSSAKLAQLGRIAAGVAHEINNPTSIIYGYASQLKVLIERGESPPEKLSQIAGKIETVTVRIVKIIKGLRNFARDGEQDPFIDTPLLDMLEEAFELLREQMRDSSVDLIVDPVADRALSCECRTVQISQVLVNLMQNATDAIASLQTKWIRVSLADLGDRVSILIRDSGSGIPEQVRARLMEPFFTTKAQGKGTGLGLSISRGLIEGHGGRLYLDDRDPNTCFVIELPKTQAQRTLGGTWRNSPDPGTIEP